MTEKTFESGSEVKELSNRNLASDLHDLVKLVNGERSKRLIAEAASRIKRIDVLEHLVKISEANLDDAVKEFCSRCTVSDDDRREVCDQCVTCDWKEALEEIRKIANV